MSRELPEVGTRLPPAVGREGGVGKPSRGAVPSDSVVRLLEELDEVQKSGAGWLARCPAHDDENPSLSIGEGDDGRALLHCFAGCETEAVVEALGLEWSDLFGDDASDAGDAEEQPQKVRLARLAQSEADFFCDQHDRPFAWIEVEDHRELWTLRGRKFEHWLYGRYFEETGNVPDSGAVNNAIGLLGHYAFSSPARELYNRFARHDGAIWYDPVGPKWRAIRITADGWEFVEVPPPLFRRFAHEEEQVEPVGGGNLEELMAPFIKVLGPDDRILFLVALVAALLPDVPRVVLILHGPQGSGKTTLVKTFRGITDPSSAPVPRTPNRPEELAQLLDHHAVLCLDNLSSLDAETSDTLCRAVTGEGFTKRELYTDEGDILFEYQRQIVLNGINVPARRADLLDRSILLSTEQISPDERREGRALRAEFEAARPKIFGAVLDALVGAMCRVDEVDLDRVPRMADWTRYGYAIAESMGLGGDAFLRAYVRNRRDQNREAIESHPVGSAVLAFMRDRDHWEGAPSRLLELLERVAAEERISTRQAQWPGSPDWLTRRLREVETNLKAAGIRVVEGSRSRDTRTIALESIDEQLDFGVGGGP